MQNQSKAPIPFGQTVIVVALATLASQSALARLEEVIVTAQKREQNVQDVPSSIVAFTEDMLAMSQTRNFDDLGQIASGMEITPSSDGFGGIIKIRGVGSNAFVAAIRPAVGIFLDEVPLGSSEAAYNNMADIERIEVLKGPQATLFGKEVSAGAISLFTRRPDTEVIDAYVEGNFGNYDLQEYRIGGNLPLGDDFAIRGSVYSNERDGTIDNSVLNREEGGRDATGYRLRMLWDINENFQAILGYEDHEVEVDGTVSSTQQFGDLFYAWEQGVEGIADPDDSKLEVIDPHDYRNAHAAPGFRETDTEIWSLHLSWLINDEWSMTSVTSDQSYFLHTAGVNGSGFVNSEGVVVEDSAGTSVGPYQINNFLQDSGTDTFTQELRFSYEGETWSSIIGAFYAETDLLSVVDFNLLALQLGGLSVYAPGISDLSDDTTEWALFNHNIYSISEQLDLTFGVRYSEVEKEARKGQPTGWGAFADLIHPLVPTSPWGDEIPEQKDSWDEVTGTLKLTYWPSDEVSLYAGWDRGFKAGGHNVCKGSEEEAICPEPFASETADNFEVGVKSRLLGNTLQLNAAAFYQTYDDYQVEVQDEQGIGNSVLNAAAVEISGAELDFQWLASDRLLLDGNLAYVDARWDDYANAGCLRPQYQALACDETQPGSGVFVQDLSGKRLNYTSPWSANLNATWNDSFSNGINWYLRGEVTFKDDRYFFPDLDPDLTDGSYTTFNASLGFSGESANWDVILWAKNITNEEYLTSGARNRDANQFPEYGGPAVEGYRVVAGLDRTYGITLKYRWSNP